MGAAEIETLRGLVDSSLKTTQDYGIVNFHHLHKVLHGILSHLGLEYNGRDVSTIDQKAVTEGDSDLTENVQDGKRATSTANQAETSQNSVIIEDGSGKKSTDHITCPSPEDMKPEGQEVEKLKFHQQHLESKISNLEDKLKLLDNFPTNQTIIQEAQQSNSTSEPKESTLSGIWQFMKINRRLQAAEEGIDRIMSILNEFLGSGQGKSLIAISNSIQGLSSELQQLKDQLNTFTSKENSNGLTEDDLTRHISGLATIDELKEYVTWPALEEALQIRKQNNTDNDIGEVHIMKIDDQNCKKDKVETRPKSSPAPPTQTPVSVPEVPKTAIAETQAESKESNQDNENKKEEQTVHSKEVTKTDDKNTHPSPEMVECLRRISLLHDENKKINDVIATKMDKASFVLPPDLQSQLDELKKGLQTLAEDGSKSNNDQDTKCVAMDNKDKIDSLRRELAALSRQAKQTYIERPPEPPAFDNDALLAIQRKLTDLENSQDTTSNRTNNTEKKMAELLENIHNNQSLIDALYKQIHTLNDVKADKENVAMEMDFKADKAALDNKVNTTTFDTTFTMLDEGLREALQKMDDYLNEEMALKNALKQLSCDMKEKMDNEAFKAMQKYLEKRIADVQKSRTMIAREANVDLNNAAGLRRPLPNFHCISCNRPVDVKYNGKVEPSLPKADSVHIKKSKGPYLTYEIDQLRHMNRGQKSRPDLRSSTENVSTMTRQCGGSHTVVGQRKPTRIVTNNAAYSVNGTSREDSVRYPNWTREVSIIDFLKGSDGHLYKGRYKAIPPISNSKKHKHTPSEGDLPPLRNDPSPPLTGHKWNSEPELSRARDEVELGEGKQSMYINTSKPLTPPTSANNAPLNARYKRLYSQRPSDIGSSSIPSPSPPTAKDNEFQRRIDREAFLLQQQQELTADERLFSPRKEYHGSPPTEQQHFKDEPAQNMYSPQSPRMSHLTKKGGEKPTDVIGLDFAKRQISMDSVDDVIS